jgi:transposase
MVFFRRMARTLAEELRIKGASGVRRSRRFPSLIGIEACGWAHHWGWTLRSLGHDVRLTPAASVKPFVKSNKNDARDAAAICAASGHAFCRYQEREQQASRGLERGRDLLSSNALMTRIWHCQNP